MLPWQVICLIVATLGNLILAVLVGARMRTLATTPLTLGLALSALWAGLYGLELQVGSLEAKVLLLRLRALFMPFYTLVMFEAAYRFVYGRRGLTGWKLAAALVIPILTLVFAWLPGARMFRYDYWLDTQGPLTVLRFTHGPWSQVFALQNFGLLAFGIGILLRTLKETPWERRGRLMFIASSLVCFTFDFLYSINAPFVHGINYAPIAFSLATIGVGLALLRWNLVDLAPVARATLIEHLDEAILVLDSAGRVVDFNRAAGRVLGLASDGALGRPWPELLAGWPEAVAWIRAHAEGRTEIRQADRFYELGVIPVADARGRVCSRLLLLRDITRRRHIEEELRRSKEVAEAADQAKSRFLAMMSHEIRTPMNGVVGFAQLLQSTPLNPEQREYLDFIASSGRSLLVIIDDVLDYSKIAAGRLEIEEIPCSPVEVVDRVGQLFQPRFAEKGLALSWGSADDVPATVLGDPVRIEQILSNLVGNALKFTDQGRVEVRLRRRPEPAGSDRCALIIEVRDTGIGIAPDVRDHLFRPFGQADSSITRRYGGTGLGLIIARRLCELMGGSLDLESELGVGSVFTAVIRPRIEPAGAGSRLPALPTASYSPSLNVLVFEDNIVNQHLIKVMLKKLGHRFVLVENGPAGLEVLERESFDAILMDIEMPGMDGYEVVRRLRAKESATAARRRYIIAVTAHALKGEREKCLAAGMDDYLSKPFTREALQEALNRSRHESTRSQVN